MGWPLIMHVNFCEQGQTIEETCMKAVKWGYDGIEFRRRSDSSRANIEKYLNEIERAKKQSGLEHIVFGSPGPELMDPDKSVRESEVEKYLTFIELAAQRFDLRIMSIHSGGLVNPSKKISASSEFQSHGSFIAQDYHWRRAAEGMKEICKLAEKKGIKLAFEIHMCYLHDTMESTMKLINLIGSDAIGVNLDYGNIRSLGLETSIEEAVALAAGRLYYVHFKNSIWHDDGFRIKTCLGDGDINHREYISILRKHKYNGPICIESTKKGDREWYARQDIGYLLDVIEGS